MYGYICGKYIETIMKYKLVVRLKFSFNSIDGLKKIWDDYNSQFIVFYNWKLYIELWARWLKVNEILIIMI